MIERISMTVKRMRIKWKLMLGATVLIFLLFASYNFAQYLVLRYWMLNQEKSAIQRTMGQFQEYLLDKASAAVSLQTAETQSYMDKLVGDNEMIRFNDPQGVPLLVATNQFDADWIVPQHVDTQQLLDTSHGEDHILILRGPVNSPTLHGTIEIASNLETFDHFNQTLFWVMIIGGMLAVGISAISGLALARQFMRPIRALDSAIRSVKQKGLRERVANIENGDELSSLAELFNDLMNQLEGSFRQQKQFVEDASHELRTPITIMEGHLSLLNRWGKADPAVLNESLEASLLEVRRLKGIVQELLTLTKVESPRLWVNNEPVSLEPVLIQTVERVENIHPDFVYQVETAEISGVDIEINPLHLEQVLLIVLDNAVKYSVEHKRIVVQAHLENKHVLISVQDQGIGIPHEDLPYVFDRFYRVDKARNREIGGTGLGLSIAKQIVHNYHGEMLISSAENQGTKVTIKLPIC
ncbi:ATP-binding protein [Paenibacillus sp. GCM10027628]|uniref:HAMP domain-containing sensor histidine kinase n=1 Tax=Paenibacillus sp. GCM10027628 TaxID=3273413 RepID=UPI00362A894D